MAPTLEKEDSVDEKAAKVGIPLSRGIELDIPRPTDGGRPPNIRHMYGKRPSSLILVIN